jgi:hypothetical protein
MDYDFKETLDSLIWSTNDQVEFKKLTEQVRDVSMNLRNKFRTSAYQVGFSNLLLVLSGLPFFIKIKEVFC